MRSTQLLAKIYEADRIMSNDRQRWLAMTTADSIARAIQVQVETEKLLAELRANPRGLPDNRDANEKDRDDERNGVAS